MDQQGQNRVGGGLVVQEVVCQGRHGGGLGEQGGGCGHAVGRDGDCEMLQGSAGQKEVLQVGEPGGRAQQDFGQAVEGLDRGSLLSQLLLGGCSTRCTLGLSTCARVTAAVPAAARGSIAGWLSMG